MSFPSFGTVTPPAALATMVHDLCQNGKQNDMSCVATAEIARQRGLRAPRTGAITFVQRFGGLVNLNVHFHLLMRDGVFVADDDQLAFALHPVPTSADVLAILDRVVRRIARRLADEVCDDRGEGIDVLAQIQAEAAATWRSPTTADRPCALAAL